MNFNKIDHLQNKRIAEAIRKLNDYPSEDFNKQNIVIEEPRSIKSLKIISDQVKKPIIHIAEDETLKDDPKDINNVKALLESVKQIKPEEKISLKNTQIDEEKNIYPVKYTNNLISQYEDIIYKVDSCLTTSSFEDGYNTNI